MNLDLTEEQVLLGKVAREFLSSACPPSVVRELEADGTGFSADLWRQMAELGWLGLTMPADFGGTEASLTDALSVHEEIGRSALLSPYLWTTRLAAELLLAAEGSELRDGLLQGIADGSTIVVPALDDASPTTAHRTDEGWRLEGSKLFVPYAGVAGWLICRAAAPDGPTLFLVERDAAGVELEALATISGERLYKVNLVNVLVPDDRRIGNIGAAGELLSKAEQPATIAHCAEMVGAMQAILDKLTEYLKDREQFDRPIASFQAIQHRLANLLLELDGARLATRAAAQMLDEGAPCEMEVAMAKAFAGDAFLHASTEGCQLMGGYGFMEEGDMQLYFRRAIVAEERFGSPRAQRERIAQALSL